MTSARGEDAREEKRGKRERERERETRARMDAPNAHEETVRKEKDASISELLQGQKRSKTQNDQEQEQKKLTDKTYTNEEGN